MRLELQFASPLNKANWNPNAPHWWPCHSSCGFFNTAVSPRCCIEAAAALDPCMRGHDASWSPALLRKRKGTAEVLGGAGRACGCQRQVCGTTLYSSGHSFYVLQGEGRQKSTQLPLSFINEEPVAQQMNNLPNFTQQTMRAEPKSRPHPRAFLQPQLAVFIYSSLITTLCMMNQCCF